MTSRVAELIAKLTDQVSGPAKGMAGALKGTVSALDALKAKAGRLDAFKKASRDLDDAAQKFKLAQQNVRKIKADMDAAGGGGQKLAASLRSAERAAEAAKNSFKSQGQEVRAMRAALAEAGVPLNQLAAYEAKLRGEIEKTTAALKTQQGAAFTAIGTGKRGGLTSAAALGGGGNGIGLGALAGAGAGALRFGAAAAGIGGGAYLIGEQVRRAAKSSMDFERSMIEVGKATDTQGAELDAYGERLLKLSRQTGKTKEELASMLSSAGFAGRPKDELLAFTEYAAKATVAWGTTAEETGQSMAELGNIYGANQRRIEEIGDAINAMADNSASRETDLMEFLRRAGATGKTSGIAAEQMLAFGAAMKEVGVRNETAGTAMEAFLNVMKLGEEFSKSAGKGLEELSIDSTKMRKAFVAKPIETMVDLLEKLNKVADPLKKAEIMTNLFGKEYQDDMAKLLNALPQINKYLGMMGDKAQIAKSSVRSQFGQNANTDVQRIARATAAIDEAYKRLGDPVKSILGSYAESLNTAADRLDRADTPIQRLLKRFESEDKAKAGAAKPGGPSPETSLIGRLTTKAFGLVDPESARAAAANDLALAESERLTKVEKVAALEKEIAAARAKAIAGGSSERGADAVTRNRQVELRLARQAVQDAEKAVIAARDAAAKLDTKPLRMGTDPLAPIQGQPGLITPGTKSWQDAYPIQLGTRQVPLPPQRPSSLPTAGAPSGVDDVRELLGTEIKPKVDLSALEQVGPKADQATASLQSINGVTVSPNVSTGELDALIAKANEAHAALARIPGAVTAANQSIASVRSVAAAPARTGAVAAARSGSFTSQGMG